MYSILNVTIVNLYHCGQCKDICRQCIFPGRIILKYHGKWLIWNELYYLMKEKLVTKTEESIAVASNYRKVHLHLIKSVPTVGLVTLSTI